MKKVYGSLLVAAALAAASVRAISMAEAPPRPVAVASYTVEPGDTLWTIARRLNPNGDPRVTIERVMRLNGLSSATVHPGDTLQLPSR